MHQAQLRGFFSRLPTKFELSNGAGNSGIKPIESANINWYVMRLVDANLIRYHEAKDGTYELNDLADLHEMLDEKLYYEQQTKRMDKLTR